MRIVRAPGFQAFRITIVSHWRINCLTHELMMHDAFPLYPPFKAPPAAVAKTTAQDSLVLYCIILYYIISYYVILY